MADRVSAKRRQRNLASYHRRVAERRERGLCIRCGKRPPAPERSICASCGEKAGAAARARAAHLRAEGKPVRDPEARRRADRERGRRQHAERRAAGLCVKCGRTPALPERTQCGPCAEKRLAADRARHARARAEGKPRRVPEAVREADRERCRRRRAERTAAGLCIRCGHIPPEAGRSTCEPSRDDLRAAKRARRAERRAASLCETCAALRDRAIRSNLRSLARPPITAPIPRASAGSARSALRLAIACGGRGLAGGRSTARPSATRCPLRAGNRVLARWRSLRAAPLPAPPLRRARGLCSRPRPRSGWRRLGGEKYAILVQHSRLTHRNY